MRTRNRHVAYEDRNRAAGLCTRSKQHGRIDPRSKNLCAACLVNARTMRRAAREKERQCRARLALLLVKKPVQSVAKWEWRRIA